MRIFTMNRLLFICLLGVALFALAGLQPNHVGAAPLPQASCTLPATVTTAGQLSACITAANGNGAGLDTITLGADINLSSALPQITTAITLEGAGYTLDGGNSVQIFNVGIAGDLTINEATLQNGFATNGGAIYNDGTLTLSNSTLSGNNATTGAAVFNFLLSTVTATNSTFSGNNATNLGGAIYNLDTLILTSNTFADNAAPTGGSLYNATSALYLAGNIFAKGTNGANCFSAGTLTDNGYNLSDDATCTNGGTGSATNASLLLGVLADNGGPTQTRLPSAGSDAIGAIPNGTLISNNGTSWACKASAPFVDQRGEARPQSSTSDCTAGAVEVATTSTTLTIIKDANPALGTDFDFTINSAPLTSYSGSTSGNPFWTRPNEGSTCTLSTVSTRYHVQAFMVDTSGNYNLASSQFGFNGYIHLYQDSFNPLTPCTNYLNGDDNALSSSSSEISGQFLEAGQTYYFVISGYTGSATGNFTNSINGPGNAYTLYDAFTLDDAAPDDGDSVSNTVTYNVTPGTYSITELLPNSLWTLSNATCTGAGGTVSLTDETLSVAISNGEAVQCTFVNEVNCPASWTVTTADELAACITLANANESPSPTADTIMLGADITLSTALPQISSAITLEGANYFIDGGHSVQLFYVTSGGDFTVNQATLQNGAAVDGGGIYNSGTLTVTDSTFSGNSGHAAGGGIYNETGTLTATNSTFSGNDSARGDGGGIYISNGTVMVTNSTFTNHSVDLRGGGIYISNGAVTVTNSTFSGNDAGWGGIGIYNDAGTLTVTNSTFFGTTNPSDITSITNNNGALNLASNIFANGTPNCNNNGGTLNDNGYNLSDDATCVNGGTGSVTNATLNLGDLADNGGPTQTHLPSASSDAIGAIPNGTTISNNGASWTCDQSATDQRGELRPINSGDGCTAGAVEVTPICTSWTVTTAEELSDCITLANANESPSPTADTITLGTDITLSTALPQIASAITLEGAGYAVDGGNSVQLFYVTAAGDFTVNQATLQNGDSATNGGGIYNSGTLAVTDSTISGNSASEIGGGIYNSGTATVSNSTLSGSTATHDGGGISNGGTLTVTESTFSGNSANSGDGGGIDNEGGTVTVTESTFSGNAANSYGSGISNYGTATVANSTFVSNLLAKYGGGIGNRSGALTVSNSTFSGNSADTGGGIHNEATATVSNSTFFGNSAFSNGDSIYNYNASSTLYLAGNIFEDGANSQNCGDNGTLTDNGYNLSDDASCGFSGTSADSATLNLGALADNGGPTQTHLPGAGSDAIGAIPSGTTVSNNGTTWTCNQTATDQRGELRPITALTACTAGAVEVAMPPICPSWTVTTAAELSDCITLANANESPSPTADTITLGADITLSTALPQIASAITLEGAGYAIDGGNSVQLFYVTSSGDFTVNQATLQNGSATDGGAIYNNNGRLTMTNSTISGNVATTDKGGGIFNKGTLIVTDSTISGNSANFHGGGIHNDGTLTVSNSTFSGNRTNTGFGGGINTNGSLIVSNSTFSGNIASHSGGGITNWSTATVRNSTFSANRAGNGGGIHNEGDTLTATNNTFVDNRGNWGGTSISNYYASARVYLAGNIFADNSTDENCYTAQGNMVDVFIDNGYNLSEDATCVNSGTGSATNATLAMGALADNGGPTQTHLPGAGSAAIGAIPNGTTISNNGTTWTCNQTTTDQQGESRPINAGTACTAGAVEVELPPICTSWTVTTAVELADCITLANANESPSPTADTITLGADITLTTALPQITSAITLEGAGYAVDGGNSVRLFYVTSTGDFTVNQAILQNGYSATDGGGISNSGTVVVSNSTISGNSADYGGGISNSGTLTVSNSTISGNSAIYGGGIEEDGGTVTVSNSTITGNTAAYGGGIGNIGTLTIINSTLSGNIASGNQGGAIANSNGTIIATNSTFSNNHAENIGGVIYSDINGNVTIINSTFSGNSSGALGSSIYTADSTLNLAGNIFADGSGSDNCINDHTLNDNGYNLSDDASCVDGGTGSATNATLPLGALADNGGPTLTHLPGAGSDAIGAIPNGTTISNNGTTWTCNQSGTDQRGELRPINSGSACTAGAVEVVPPATVVVGDVNCDDTVTIADALIILQYDVGLRTDSGGCPLGDSATELDAANGDVNVDGFTTISDALLILQCDVGMTNDFCPVTTVVANEALPSADESAVAKEAADEEDEGQVATHQLFLPLVTR